jgi:stearoyl-CoA desaturase (delta-9 desaturase)
LRTTLEREYQQFTESVNEWTSLQAQRYEDKKAEIGGALNEKKQRLQQKWERAALRTQFKELEYSLKMQRKRIELLMDQMRLQAQATAT